jgi:ABC-2 type transport system permease protein
MSASPTTAVLRTEARLFGRELGSVFWIVLFPTVLLCILGAIPDFRDPDPAIGGQRLVDLYVPVAVLLSMIMAAIMAMPPVVMGYRERGILRRLRTTPVPPGSLLLAQTALHAAAVLASVVLVLAVGRIVFDTPLPGNLAGYAVALVLALAAAFSIGAVVTAVAPNSRIGTTIGTIVFFPAMFTAGVWAPVQAMGGLLRDIVVATPLGAASEALHDAMTGDFPDLVDLAVMAGWTVLLAALAVRLFRWE